jgi:hypothetical protein
MKHISTKVIVTLMTATLGLSAIAPVTAQEAAPTAEQAQPAEQALPSLRTGMHRGDGLAGLLDFKRGVEGVEIALVRLSHAVDLTQEQQALFGTLRTDAIAAADTFERATEGQRPTPSAAGEAAALPDMSERLENRIALTEAQLAALKAMQPSFSAFFDSLTEKQKAAITPDRGERGERAGQFGGEHERRLRHGGPGGRPMGGPNNG